MKFKQIQLNKCNVKMDRTNACLKSVFRLGVDKDQVWAYFVLGLFVSKLQSHQVDSINFNLIGQLVGASYETGKIQSYHVTIDTVPLKNLRALKLSSFSSRCNYKKKFGLLWIEQKISFVFHMSKFLKSVLLKILVIPTDPPKFSDSYIIRTLWPCNQKYYSP